MSQVTDYDISGSPLTMASFVSELEDIFDALGDSNRGATAPDNPFEGMLWLDTSGGATAEILKRYTATGGWVSILTFNITTGTITQIHGILDEDNMASDSAVLPPSQQSAKAYFMAKTGANLAIGSDADGDIYYRAAGALARLAKGAANYKLFMNAGATAPEWASGVKIGTFTRDMSLSSGDVAYSGVGFKPSAVIFISAPGVVAHSISVGFDDGTGHYAVFGWGAATSLSITASSSISLIEAAGDQQTAIIKTLDADGFTLTWTKAGSPTQTGTMAYLAIR